MPLYFAYGSNMSETKLRHRLQHNQSVLKRRLAILRDHRLAFEKVSSTNPAVGYANVVAASGRQVEGIVVELNDDALVALDEIELVPHHYDRTETIITDCAKGREVLAYVYTARPSWIRPGLKPLRSYVEGLMQGADLLSPEYVAMLSNIECYEDVARGQIVTEVQQTA